MMIENQIHKQIKYNYIYTSSESGRSVNTTHLLLLLTLFNTKKANGKTNYYN